MKKLFAIITLMVMLFICTYASGLGVPEASKNYRHMGMCIYDTGSSKWVAVESCEVTGTLKVIEHMKSAVVCGNAFTCSYSNTVTNVGEMTAIAFNTPDTTTWIHVIATVSSSAGSRFGIYRSPSMDNGEGTELAIYNMNENSTGASVVSSIAATPVVNKATSWNETQAAGANITKTIEILPVELGVGSGPFQQGGQNANFPFVCKQGTQYAFILTANTANDDIHNITLVWDEHVDR